MLNGDRRREALNVIDVRLLQLVKELPGVRRERFDVFALALGKQRVKRQRRLARPTWPGNHHQLVAGNLKRQILEIVLPCPGYLYEPLGHRKPHRKPPCPLGQARALASYFPCRKNRCSIGSTLSMPTARMITTPMMISCM